MSQRPASEPSRCVRCGRAAAGDELDLYAPCAIRVRIDVSTGLVRLERFLAQRRPHAA